MLALVPKQRVEAELRKLGHRRISISIFHVAKPLGEVGHDPQSVVPEGLYLDWLAGSRRYHQVADLRIHPRQLHARLARVQQSVGIDVDVVSRAAEVPHDDVRKFFVELVADEVEIIRLRHVGADRFEVPERRIDSVVLRLAPGIGKTIRQHPFRDVIREFEKDPACDLGTIRRERQSVECDHRVAAPIREPRIAGDDRVARATPDDELVGRKYELLFEIVLCRSRFR